MRGRLTFLVAAAAHDGALGPLCVVPSAAGEVAPSLFFGGFACAMSGGGAGADAKAVVEDFVVWLVAPETCFLSQRSWA